MTRRAYNPQTAHLAKIAGTENNILRLTKADREFLTDLAKVQIISAVCYLVSGVKMSWKAFLINLSKAVKQ